jgi:hypothetical protein
MAPELLTMPLKLVAAGVIAGILSSITGYAITGRIFHVYQSRTPNTWRATETWAEYLYSFGIRVFSCLAIVLLYYVFGAGALIVLTGTILRGATFGGFIWAAIAAPVIVEAALFVNWHRGFVVGLLLDWLVLCVVAGAVASLVTGAI